MCLSRLQIYEVSDTKLQRLSPAAGLYGKYGGEVQISSDGITDYKTLGNTFYLDYKGLPTQEYSGFTLLFTEFHGKNTENVRHNTIGQIGVCKVILMY